MTDQYAPALRQRFLEDTRRQYVGLNPQQYHRTNGLREV
jgi:hypothetical protein